MKTRAKRGLALVVTAVLAAGVGLGFAFTPADSDADADAEHDAPPPFTMETDVEVMLLRIGITPEVVAAAGVQSSTLQSALSAELEGLEAAVSTLATHDAACAAAKREVDALKREVQSGLGTEQDVTDLAAAKAALESATAARNTFLAGICAGLCENLSGDANTAIHRMCASKRWKTLPAAYRVEDRTEAEWLAIRDALASKKTHERFGDAVPAETTQFLASLDADADVAAAASSSASYLAGVQTLWDGVFVD